jgi:hypothetical protein
MARTRRPSGSPARTGAVGDGMAECRSCRRSSVGTRGSTAPIPATADATRAGGRFAGRSMPAVHAAWAALYAEMAERMQDDARTRSVLRPQTKPAAARSASARAAALAFGPTAPITPMTQARSRGGPAPLDRPAHGVERVEAVNRTSGGLAAEVEPARVRLWDGCRSAALRACRAVRCVGPARDRADGDGADMVRVPRRSARWMSAAEPHAKPRRTARTKAWTRAGASSRPTGPRLPISAR